MDIRVGKGVMDKEGAEYVATITALAINDSVRRRAAEETKSKILRI